MGVESESIVCRRCDEVYSIKADNCPHCGRRQAGRGYWIAAGAGVIIGVTSIGSGLWVFGLVGLLLTAVAGYFLYDKHERRQEATQRAMEESSDLR